MAARVRFGLLVAMFQAMSKDRTSAKKRGRLRVFLDCAYGPSGRDDYFSALRLVLPGLDRERGSYGLKEAVLATVLVDALGIAKDSTDAVRLINWRRGGGFRNAGNFSLVAAEVQRSHIHSSSSQAPKFSDRATSPLWDGIVNLIKLLLRQLIYT
jgi:DNA ligase 4